MRSQLGIVGLDDFSANIAINLAQVGVLVSLFHVPFSFENNAALDFVLEHKDLPLRAGEDYVDFVISIETPRRIFVHTEAVTAEIDHILLTLQSICTSQDRIFIVFSGEDHPFLWDKSAQSSIELMTISLDEFVMITKRDL
jgi:6-phosphogluconate dehydrogenase